MSKTELQQQQHFQENQDFPTPFDNAKSEWDDRFGKLAITNRGLWYTVGSLILIVALLIVFLFYAMNRSSIEPWLVVVDVKGVPIKVVPMKEVVATPDELNTATHLSQFIEYTRAVYSDKVLMRQKWMHAYLYAGPGAAAQLTEFALKELPHNREDTVKVEIISVQKVPGTDSYQARWKETITTPNGAEQPAENWTGIFNVAYAKPDKPDELLKNPLTMKIQNYTWQREY